MNTTARDQVRAIHKWIKENQESATAARNKLVGNPRRDNNRIMLAGKVKALTQAMNFITDRYSKYFQIDP